MPGMELAGGARLEEELFTAYSPDVTPHPEDGIGDWTDEEIKRAITRGVRPDGERLFPPMGYRYYANMTDEDLDALVAYLRSPDPIASAEAPAPQPATGQN